MRIRWAGHVARIGETRNAYKILIGKPERKKPLGRFRRRWEDNFKMNVREIGFGSVCCTYEAQHRDWWWTLVNTLINLWVP
jgi:hypothetical protein